MPQSTENLSDDLVHLGRPARVEGRHVNLPVELGSTFVFDTMEAFETARDARYDTGTLYYGRYGTAASFGLEDLLAQLEGAASVTLPSSGVAAISSALMAFCASGKHLLVADNVYGNTRAFCDSMLPRIGVKVEYFDPMAGPALAERIRETTCAVMFEAPGSGTFEVPDIPAITAVARAAGVPSILDSTWATPIFCRPLTLGADVVVASMSKYLSGHSDCMMGMIASTRTHAMKIRKTVGAFGDKPGAQEVFLALRGLRTLKMRMHHFDSAGRDIATWLSRQPQVKTILHPAFDSCPGHENWQRDFSGAASLFGVVFHPCPEGRIHAFVDALQHFGIGVSWGGYESLALPVQPVRTAKPWSEPGQLVRFNIGLEDVEPLKADLAAALPLIDTVGAPLDAQ